MAAMESDTLRATQRPAPIDSRSPPNSIGFFHDHEALAALETIVIPRLFASDADHKALRVWVPGCATGEAAYAVAILFREYADQLGTAPNIQIFATDSDGRAIAAARQGLYPETIVAQLSPKRRQRFFN